jgi:hypothetical protein
MVLIPEDQDYCDHSPAILGIPVAAVSNAVLLHMQ